jgi:hypothetical protein
LKLSTEERLAEETIAEGGEGVWLTWKLLAHVKLPQLPIQETKFTTTLSKKVLPQVFREKLNWFTVNQVD